MKRNVGVLLLGALSCGDNQHWQQLRSIDAELDCGMNRATVAEIASRHGAELKRGPDNPWGGWVVLVDESPHALSLDIQSDRLHRSMLTRQVGIKRVCTFPQRDLCSGDTRIPVTIDYAAALEGSTLFVDGRPDGILHGNARTIMLPKGSHRVHAASPAGEEVATVLHVEPREPCREDYLRVVLDGFATPPA